MESTSSAIKTVGVIGAGRMGMPIIGHLKKHGFTVLVSDLHAGKYGEIESKGGVVKDVPALSRESDAILVCVGYDAEVRELLGSAGDIASHAKQGAIVAILSTVHPKTVQALADKVRDRGIEVIDSTICRGGRAADDGTLLSFVGGDKAVVDKITPVLSAYSSDVVHSGALGTAQVAKAANNLILWACLVANHEGLALASRYGVDIDALRKALMTSTAVNGALGNWGKQSMAWADDDMEIVSEMARDCGIALPQTGMVREICRSLKPKRYELDKYGV
ncbi:MAG TPA: NAD(P)-dependent oxidoreductase [Herbaspirillum sp.]|jgi:3-hydroxyisobutyrate dehydrogenase|nr:NAD(P)-dependent oxidoreductase [Herbaspirillum sp.]